MTIPDYQSCMLVLLKLCADKKEHVISEAIDSLGAHFKLSEQERSELLPSGRQARFDNRVHWAKAFLLKAGVLETAGRARFKITARGEKVLSENLTELSDKYLMRFPEFAEFRHRARRESKAEPDEAKETSKTPLEMLEESYINLKQSLVQELIDTVKSCSPRFSKSWSSIYWSRWDMVVLELMLVLQLAGPGMVVWMESLKKISSDSILFIFRQNDGPKR